MSVQSIAGLVVFACIAWLISENRTKVSIKIIVAGIAIQLAVGFILLKLPVFRDFFISLNRLVLSLEESTAAGTSMVFGYLGGGDLPFAEKFPGASFILAFRALPLILVISSLSALLFYWKILPIVVRLFPGHCKKPWAWAAPRDWVFQPIFLWVWWNRLSLSVLI